jgi:hypothetical protein
MAGLHPFAATDANQNSSHRTAKACALTSTSHAFAAARTHVLPGAVAAKACHPDLCCRIMHDYSEALLAM